MEELDLQTFAESLVLNFYLYEGSLSTPDCDEDVYYFVIEEPQYLTDQQLRLITEKSTYEEGINLRGLQEINDREIYKVINVHSYDDAYMPCQISLLFITSILSFLFLF
jgi:carbonic anhydrase